MVRLLTRRTAPATLLALAALLTACSGSTGSDPFAGQSSGVPSTSASRSGTASASPSADPAKQLRCGDVIKTTTILDALGVTLDGNQSYVWSGPDKASKRLSRVTCGYGVAPGPDGKNASKLTVAVNAYPDPDTAAGKLSASIDSATGKGQAVTAQALGARAGYLVGDAANTSYLVVDGARTVVLTLAKNVVPAQAESVALVDIATAIVGDPGESSTADPSASPAPTATG